MLRLALTKSQRSSGAAGMSICNSCAPARNARKVTHIGDFSLAMQTLLHTGSNSALDVPDFEEDTYAQIAGANLPGCSTTMEGVRWTCDENVCPGKPADDCKM